MDPVYIIVTNINEILGRQYYTSYEQATRALETYLLPTDQAALDLEMVHFNEWVEHNSGFRILKLE